MGDKIIKTISIADDFSPYPAGRYEEDGDFSGAAFRDKHLIPALQEVIEKKIDGVKVIFDGVAGLGSSFLEESFGGLVREDKRFDEKFLKSHLILKAEDESLRDYPVLARHYIEKAHSL